MDTISAFEFRDQKLERSVGLTAVDVGEYTYDCDWCKRELGWEYLYSTNWNASVCNFYQIVIMRVDSKEAAIIY